MSYMQTPQFTYSLVSSLFFNVDHFKSLYWICYSIATVFSFVFFFWSQGTWDLSSHSCTLCIGRQSLNHWTTRKSPLAQS